MPNKKKKGFKRCQSQPKPVTNMSTRRRPTTIRKQWTETQMLEALKSVQKDGLSGNVAADLHGVPRSTLKDRLSGRVRHRTKPGPKPYLSIQEESELATHLLQAADIGFGKTRRDVKCIVEEYLRRKGTLKGTTVSDGWWEKFVRRNPILRLRSGDSTAHVRMDAINAENLHAYYNLLKSVYDEHGFDSHPEAIYNMDETGVPLEPRPPKVVAAKGKRKVRYRTSGQKSQITVIGCASATGQVLPPYIIFAAKQLNELWTHEVCGSRYAVSNKGWVDQELFFFWLKVHFIPNAISHRPLLLLLDGHSSHFEPNTIQHAQDNNIIIFCLPPHTTHECQPLDCSLFGPLKKHWQEACHNFYQRNPGKLISKINFNSVFRNAWLNAVTPANICGGFRKAGVYPFNPDAVEVPESSSGDSSSSSSSSGDGGSNRSSSDDGDFHIHDSGNGGSSNSSSGDHSGSTGDFGSNVSGDGSRTGSIGSDLDELGGNSCDLGDPFCDPSVCLSGGTDEDPIFTIEEELRFAIRFDEGYDLFDPKYEVWLRIHHPESANKAQIIQSPALVDPSTLQKTTDSSPSMSSLSKTTTSVLSNNCSPSTSDLSKDSSPSVSSLSKDSSPSMSGLSKDSSLSSLSKNSSPSTSGLSKKSSPPMSGLSKNSSLSTSGLSKNDCSQDSTGLTTPKSSASKSSLTGSAKRSPLSDLLNLPTVTTPAAPKTGKARVLTSSECLRLLKEKEEKKRQVAEEKERRKQERELKKQQKEAEQKRKAEEKARRLTEREAEKAKKQAEKVQKAKEKVEKCKEKAQKEKAQERAETKRQADSGTRACQRIKRKRLLGDMDEDINTEICCVCYGTYLEDVDTGRQWLECSCARWIHEDCIDDEDVDDSGKLCPLC